MRNIKKCLFLLVREMSIRFQPFCSNGRDPLIIFLLRRIRVKILLIYENGAFFLSSSHLFFMIYICENQFKERTMPIKAFFVWNVLSMRLEKSIFSKCAQFFFAFCFNICQFWQPQPNTIHLSFLRIYCWRVCVFIAVGSRNLGKFSDS